MNIYDLFRERSRNGNDFIRSAQGESLYSYHDMDRISGELSHRLIELGVKPGDRIIVQVEKSPEALFLYFAALRCGAIYLPLNTAYRDVELTYFVANAEPSLIVCDPSKLAFYHSLLANVETLDENGQGSLMALKASNTPFNTYQSDPDDIAVILYTSGTTGKPKGAMISHKNLASNGLALTKAWQWQPTDIMLHALPVFHIHGLFVATHLPVLNGSPIIFLRSFEAEQVIDLLPSATVYMGVPTNYTRLIATHRLTTNQCRGMRLFTSGSAPLLPQTFKAFTELTGHEIVERYGMTETGMNTSNPLNGQKKPGSVGLALNGVSTKIVKDGQQVAPGEPGQLLVKGDNVFRGYWRLPEITKSEFTEDGYFRTGDVASIDAENYISIVGRDKDMIISGGLNIYPKEIEEVIDRLPGIVESAVIGLPHPDFGEGVCAVVVLQSPNLMTESDVIAAVKSELANFKVPKWVHFTETLPRNTMGKVQKNLLRDQFQS